MIAMAPESLARPACSTHSSSPPRTGTAYASASRSLRIDTLGSPSATAMARASTRTGVFVSVATPSMTGPAAPKHAAASVFGETPSSARNAAAMASIVANSRVPYVRVATSAGRPARRSNTPNLVVVPPTSPASTFAIDNPIILLHLDAVPPHVGRDVLSRRLLASRFVAVVEFTAAGGTGRRLHRKTELARAQRRVRACRPSRRRGRRGRQRKDDDARDWRRGIRRHRPQSEAEEGGRPQHA